MGDLINGKQPIHKNNVLILEDFENGIDHWQASGARYQSVSIALTSAKARFGQHSLQLNYDFTETIGASGAYAYPKEPIILEDYPKAIGMWVYGDGKGHWLRSQLRDGNGNPFPVDFVKKIDWIGWRYVEAKIPHGKTSPLKLDLPIRLMEIDDDNKNSGTIYIDQLRAVYGETNEDLINPTVFGEFPSHDEVVTSYPLKIGAFAKDNEGGSGINPSHIKMELDGIEVQHQYCRATGEISFLEMESLLKGFHQVRLVVQDYAGNEMEKVWQFEVEREYIGVKATYDKEAYVGNSFPITVQTTKLNKMERLSLHFSFDPNKVKAIQNQLLLHSKVKEHHVLVNEITADGNIYLELRNLDHIVGGDELKDLAHILLHLKKETVEPVLIKFVSGSVTIAQKEAPVFIPNIKIQPKAHCHIEINRSTVGFKSTIKVLNQESNPVQGAEIQVISPYRELVVNQKEQAILYEKPDTASVQVAKLKEGATGVQVDSKPNWLKVQFEQYKGWLHQSNCLLKQWNLGETNKVGLIETKWLFPGNVVIQAQAGEEYSFPKKVRIHQPIGPVIPDYSIHTFNENLAITWATSPTRIGSVVQILPASIYEKYGFHHPLCKEVKGESKHHTFQAGEIQIHTALLKDLRIRETYAYRVGDGTEFGWSNVRYFTMEDREQPNFTFIVMGDTQSPPHQTALFSEMLQKAKQEADEAAFIVHVGDMVDDGNLYTHWHTFFTALQSDSKALPIVPAVGNHENVGNGIETFQQYFKLPDNGPSAFEGTVYSFDYGNAHFAVLNTETSMTGLIEQGEWLKQDMAETDKKWKIAIFHRSPYNANIAAGSENVKEVWPPIFDEVGIDLAISGHDHSYVRTFPLKGGKVDENGTVYMIAGSSGQKFYSATQQSYMNVLFEERTQVYTVVRVTEETISIIVKARDGRVIDEFFLEK